MLLFLSLIVDWSVMMKRVFSMVAGVMVTALLMSGCGKEPAQETTVPKPNAAVQPAMPADHPPTEVQVEPAEVLAQLPAGHPTLEGLTDQPAAPAGHTMRPRNEPAVVVPDSVRARWKSVTLEVTLGGTKRELRVAPGEQVALGQDDLSLLIGAFLPAYMSDFSQATSDGDELSNPALQVSVLHNNAVVDKGWLFRDYPDFNTVSNARVALRLLAAHD